MGGYRIPMPQRGSVCALLVGVESLLFVGPRLARAEETALVELDELGFTLDEDWRQAWRRVMDRGGRLDPTGPIQQRFARRQYPEHQADQLVGDFMLAHEAEWARSTNQIRFWVHSYDALTLGNQVQMKMGHELGGDWRLDFRYDGRTDYVTESKMLTGDFRWQPAGSFGPYVAITINPRTGKQDTDLALTVGYDAGPLGEARLRIIALDPFTNASYALASHRKPPPDLVWKQTSLPLAFSAELLSGSWRGLHSEVYLGVIPTQHRRLFLEDMTVQYAQRDTALMLGALLEWKAEAFPLCLGAAALIVSDEYERANTADPFGTHVRIQERTSNTRLYAIIAPRADMLFETQLRFVARPESYTGPLGEHTEREDDEFVFGARGQWLLSSWFGTELSYWHEARDSSGPPYAAVDGRTDRLVTRLLFRSGKRLLISLGVGWDPAPRRSAVYGGGGATVNINFD
jgi:hypothetical protein